MPDTGPATPAQGRRWVALIWHRQGSGEIVIPLPRTRGPQIAAPGGNIREQAKDALSHYSEFVAGRQAQVINVLTIVATVFLPLSFLAGCFGMNFRILTGDVQTTLWQFILPGLLLMIASVALSLLLIRRLEQRLGIRTWGSHQVSPIIRAA